MFCKYCGAELRDSAKFCNRCGQPVGAENAAPGSVPDTVPNTAVTAGGDEFPSTGVNMAVTILTLAIIAAAFLLNIGVMPVISFSDEHIIGTAAKIISHDKKFTYGEVYGFNSKYHDAIIETANDLGLLNDASYTVDSEYGRRFGRIDDFKNVKLHNFKRGWHTVLWTFSAILFYLFVIIGVIGVLAFGCKKPSTEKKGNLQTHYGAMAVGSVLAVIAMICFTVYLYIDLPEQLFKPSPILLITVIGAAVAAIFPCGVYSQCRSAVKNFHKNNNCKW